jgi:23S rRNA pseudouridine2605 synthase
MRVDPERNTGMVTDRSSRPHRPGRVAHPRAATRPRGHVSLERAISKRGIASRSEARAWVLAGRIAVDGRIVTNPAQPVVPESARITVDGASPCRDSPVTVALNKPRGVVTTRRDPEGRPTVYDSLTDLGRHVVPVGRLDLASTGLLLLTSDTRLAAWLTDPANGVTRVYVVTVRGRLTQEAAGRMEEGIVDQGERLLARKVEVLKTSNRETHLRLVLTEGRNREVRRLTAALGYEVTRLCRMAFGGIELGLLAPGRWRRVDERELRAAFPGAPVRT